MRKIECNKLLSGNKLTCVGFLMCYSKNYSTISVNRVCISSTICCGNIDLYSTTVEK